MVGRNGCPWSPPLIPFARPGRRRASCTAWRLASWAPCIHRSSAWPGCSVRFAWRGQGTPLRLPLSPPRIRSELLAHANRNARRVQAFRNKMQASRVMHTHTLDGGACMLQPIKPTSWLPPISTARRGLPAGQDGPTLCPPCRRAWNGGCSRTCCPTSCSAASRPFTQRCALATCTLPPWCPSRQRHDTHNARRRCLGFCTWRTGRCVTRPELPCWASHDTDSTPTDVRCLLGMRLPPCLLRLGLHQQGQLSGQQGPPVARAGVGATARGQGGDGALPGAAPRTAQRGGLAGLQGRVWVRVGAGRAARRAGRRPTGPWLGWMGGERAGWLSGHAGVGESGRGPRQAQGRRASCS